jgi:hypothetical protein
MRSSPAADPGAVCRLRYSPCSADPCPAIRALPCAARAARPCTRRRDDRSSPTCHACRRSVARRAARKRDGRSESPSDHLGARRLGVPSGRSATHHDPLSARVYRRARLVTHALRAAALRTRVFAALRAAARRFRVLAAFRAAALLSLVMVGCRPYFSKADTKADKVGLPIARKYWSERRDLNSGPLAPHAIS